MYLASVYLIDPPLSGKNHNHKRMATGARMDGGMDGWMDGGGLVASRGCEVTSESCYKSETAAATA